MQRENKAMAGRQLILIEDRRTKGVKARVCVDRATGGGRGVGEGQRKRDARKEKAAPDAHPPSSIHSFSAGPLGSESKGGGTLWARETRVFFFSLPPSRSFSRFDPPLYAAVPTKDRGARVHAKTRETIAGETPGKS